MAKWNPQVDPWTMNNFGLGPQDHSSLKFASTFADKGGLKIEDQRTLRDSIKTKREGLKTSNKPGEVPSKIEALEAGQTALQGLAFLLKDDEKKHKGARHTATIPVNDNWKDLFA
tara:strand:- start:1864 stop:2208 length:345 start_codon:yes stop_codon:yes gene_type:complete